MAEEIRKPKGWHSRRHETAGAHLAAREAYQSSHGRVARRRRALAGRELQATSYRFALLGNSHKAEEIKKRTSQDDVQRALTIADREIDILRGRVK
jgi:hypothetical protein